MTTLYDVLISLIQYGMPVAGTIIGIFLGKWIEERNENKKMKREVYFEANRALSRYKDIFLVTALNFNDENRQRFHEQQMLTEAAKADLEILGSDKAVALYSDCLKHIEQAGKDILSKKQSGETSVIIASNIKTIPSYKNFLNLWRKWNDIVRKDLKIVKK